ncbi:MAG: chemotaxis protein CheW [Lachnospiraceae bacterium]|nr:chemotaxis protein CheW [Lachnospiraceae bacterium]
MDEKRSEEIEQKQYIVVKLGSEQYGIDIQYVDNIVRMQRVTRVPKAQPYFKGVINIRGEVIPVMSLRIKFGLEPDEFKNATRILIIKIEPQAAIGMIVDEVKEVITLGEESIDKGSGGNDEKSLYLSGVGKQPNGLVSLLNIPAVVMERESAM